MATLKFVTLFDEELLARTFRQEAKADREDFFSAMLSAMSSDIFYVCVCVIEESNAETYKSNARMGKKRNEAHPSK